MLTKIRNFINDTCPNCKQPVSPSSGYCTGCGWKSPKV